MCNDSHFGNLWIEKSFNFRFIHYNQNYIILNIKGGESKLPLVTYTSINICSSAYVTICLQMYPTRRLKTKESGKMFALVARVSGLPKPGQTAKCCLNFHPTNGKQSLHRCAVDCLPGGTWKRFVKSWHYSGHPI